MDTFQAVRTMSTHAIAETLVSPGEYLSHWKRCPRAGLWADP